MYNKNNHFNISEEWIRACPIEWEKEGQKESEDHYVRFWTSQCAHHMTLLTRTTAFKWKKWIDARAVIHNKAYEMSWK